MSKALAAPLQPQSPANWAAYPSVSSQPSKNVQYVQPSSSSAGSPSLAGPSVWQPPPHWNLDQKEELRVPPKPMRQDKKRTLEETEIASRTAARIAARLASDHAAVLYPNVDTPFADVQDVIQRLLPYHVYQQPEEDLDDLLDDHSRSTSPEVALRREIQETKFAFKCLHRRDALEKRFRTAQIRPGTRTAPDDQMISLAQSILESDRAENALINAELRAARSELERLEREKRQAANAARAVYATPVTSTPVIQSHYYRTYPYAYAQPYGTIPQASTSTFSVSPQSPAAYAPYQSSSAIPVQLPVSSLPALHSLGIIPVPAASLPPEGQQQPPAVLRGSTANGTMLSLEINVSLLQQAQMSGLALVLNSLMSRTATIIPSLPTQNPIAPSTNPVASNATNQNTPAP